MSICLNLSAQSDPIWHDLTGVLENERGGWSIGNACGEDFFLAGVIKSDLNMHGDELEILNSHVIIEGNIINQGTLIYLCDNSILEIKGGVLSVEGPVKEELKIYPNPAIDEINIKGVEIDRLELYDMYGRMLKNYQTVGRLHRIMIDDLESGVYFIRINNTEIHKIIKQ